MQGKQKAAEENMVRELLFDLSSAEKSVRAGAIRSLIQYASSDGVEVAVRSCYEVEQDPYCRQGLEAILEIYVKKADKREYRLLDRPLPESRKNSLPVSSTPLPSAAKPDNARKEAVPVEKKISLTSPVAKNNPPATTFRPDVSPKPEPVKVVAALPPAAETNEGLVQPAVALSTKEKLAAAFELLQKKLEWAAKNDVGVSGVGMGIIVVVLVCFSAFFAYNMIVSSERFSITNAAQMVKAVVPGEIQTGEVKSGEVIPGTLKEYNIFGHTWVFLSDDDRLFKLKLNKSPGFFKVEDRLKVLVEACEKNSLGHTVLIGSVSQGQDSGATK